MDWMIWTAAYLFLGIVVAEMALAGLRIKKRQDPKTKTHMFGVYLTTVFVWPLVLYFTIKELAK